MVKDVSMTTIHHVALEKGNKIVPSNLLTGRPILSPAASRAPGVPKWLLLDPMSFRLALEDSSR